MRALAIDVGTVRVGLAISDPLGMTAQPLDVIPRRGPKRDLAAIAKIVTEREVEVLVIGLPINMNGTEGPSVEMARAFAALLEPLGLPIEFIDERLSSAVAERILISADMRRDRRKQVRDKVAAAVILQTWLDRRAGGFFA